MKKLKQVLIQLPEYYLIVLALLAGYTPPFTIHSLAIGLAVLLLLQIIFKNRISGLIIGGLFFICNLYMLGALISELHEFQSFNSKAWQLLIGGTMLFAIHLYVSKAMFSKYSKKDNTPLYYRGSQLFV